VTIKLLSVSRSLHFGAESLLKAVRREYITN
jgi:hypothetical protein